MKTAERQTENSTVWSIEPVDNLFEHSARLYKELLTHNSARIACLQSETQNFIVLH